MDASVESRSACDSVPPPEIFRVAIDFPLDRPRHSEPELAQIFRETEAGGEFVADRLVVDSGNHHRRCRILGRRRYPASARRR